MSKGLFDKILDNMFDAAWVGKHGEKLTERELRLVKLFGRKGKVLRNVYVPKDNEETSEIDVVYITQKGIFVIESKNYSGWIFGDEGSLYWTVMLPNKMKNRFYNPIKQNQTHIKWLEQYLNDDIPLFSIIAFSERCELKKLTINSEDIHVIKRDRLYATVRSIWNSAEDALDDEKVDLVYKKLKSLTKVDDAIKAAHIESIQERYKKREETPAQQTETTDTIKTEEIEPSPDVDVSDSNSDKCPKCGGDLILRTAKKGENAGKNFYGCSNYPKCRFIQNV
ncbi:MAG: DNA-binding protein [Clostridiales bacterium]|jgi:predicted RNA-binding Zn-ribbon protein involved in translation (DUF1610 family)|nr:DNA-binding protein [Clostridiales bacterium]